MFHKKVLTTTTLVHRHENVIQRAPRLHICVDAANKYVCKDCKTKYMSAKNKKYCRNAREKANCDKIKEINLGAASKPRTQSMI